MPGLRALFLMAMLFCVLVMLGGVLAAQHFWLQPAKTLHLLNEQQGEIDSLLRMLQVQQDGLGLMADDYSQRSEVELLLNTNQQGYFSRILTPDLFETLQIDGFAILDHTRRAVMSIQAEGSIHHLNSALFNEWLHSLPLTTAANTLLLRFQNKPYFLIYRPIRDSDPSLIGWVVITKAIDQPLLDNIRTATRVDFSRNFTAEATSERFASLQTPLTSIQNTRTLCLNELSAVVLCIDIHHADAPPPLIDTDILVIFSLTLLMPVGVIIFLLSWLLRPLLHTVAVIHASSESGEIRPILLTDHFQPREVGELQTAYNRLADVVNQQHGKLEALSTTDSLTAIANRLAFDRALEDSWNRIRRRVHGVALAMIDIDHFKIFNDTYGHQQGDMALSQVAAALRQSAQRTDEIVARYGGEEFALIIYCDDRKRLDDVSNRLHNAVHELHIQHRQSPVRNELTISIGIAWIPGSGEWLNDHDRDFWLHEADSALYEAKAQGRNRTIIRVMLPAPLSDHD